MCTEEEEITLPNCRQMNSNDWMKWMVYDRSENLISQLHRPITTEDTKNVVKELFAIQPSDSDNFTKVLRNKIPVRFKLS